MRAVRQESREATALERWENEGGRCSSMDDTTSRTPAACNRLIRPPAARSRPDNARRQTPIVASASTGSRSMNFSNNYRD
jgi:hypothetical protein